MRSLYSDEESGEDDRYSRRRRSVNKVETRASRNKIELRQRTSRVSYADMVNSEDDYEVEDEVINTRPRRGSRRGSIKNDDNYQETETLSRASRRTRTRVDYRELDEGVAEDEVEDAKPRRGRRRKNDDEEYVSAPVAVEENNTTGDKKRNISEISEGLEVQKEQTDIASSPPRKRARLQNIIQEEAHASAEPPPNLNTSHISDQRNGVSTADDFENALQGLPSASNQNNVSSSEAQNMDVDPDTTGIPTEQAAKEVLPQLDQQETSAAEPVTEPVTTTPATPSKVPHHTENRKKKKDSDDDFNPDEEGEQPIDDDEVEDSEDAAPPRRGRARKPTVASTSAADDYVVAHSEEDEEDKYIRAQRENRGRTRSKRYKKRTYSSDEDSNSGDAPIRARLRPRKEKQVKPYTHSLPRNPIPSPATQKTTRYDELQAKYSKAKSNAVRGTVAPSSPPIPTPVRIHLEDSSSSSESSGDERQMLSSSKSLAKSSKYSHIAPINISQLAAHKKGKKPSADIDPMKISNVGWDSIGGLQHHVDALKEMVVLPLLYPEVFQKFDITPPRGVIFFGPPGTGKTLVARALAGTCSNGARPIAFFMRKGADILSKWVGEAEKQLRLLFDEAKKLQPSIIFFDEIDGLAPVRSSKQDYIHSSIVSTLLALMDGLDNRGQVVVIGATNRIDSIDPALRRPGRFDRELVFTLPSKNARREIFDIHTKSWKPPVPSELADDIAKRSVGYCGADIKALCAESALCALRRKYPQIYLSTDRLLIDINSVVVQKIDFLEAMKSITPASHRSAVVHARPLPNHLAPCFIERMEQLCSLIQQIFPLSAKYFTRKQVQDKQVTLQNQMSDDIEEVNSQELNWTSFSDISFLDPNISDYVISPPSFRPWILIHGEEGMGQIHLGRAVLYALEELCLFSLDFASLITNPSVRSAEEALISTFAEARKNSPSILWLPNIDEWWEKATEVLQSTLCSMLQDIPSSLNVLVIATANNCKAMDNLPHQLQSLFNEHHFQVKPPTGEQRREMFSIFVKDITRKPILRRKKKKEQLPELPKAPLPPVEVRHDNLLSEEEEKQTRLEEEHYLRELRIRLRDPMLRVLTNKRYDPFAKPVKPNAQKPKPNNQFSLPEPDGLLYLYDILENLEKGVYTSLKLFNRDIKRIVNDSHNYQPSTDEFAASRNASKAQQLYETLNSMYTFIPKPLIKKCHQITKRREQVRKEKEEREKAKQMAQQATALTSGQDQDVIMIDSTNVSPSNSTRRVSFADVNNLETRVVPPNSPQQVVADQIPVVSELPPTQRTTPPPPALETAANTQSNGPIIPPSAVNETVETPATENQLPEAEPIVEEEVIPDVQIDMDSVLAWYDNFLRATEGNSIDQLDKHFSHIYKLLYKYRFDVERSKLVDELRAYLEIIQLNEQI